MSSNPAIFEQYQIRRIYDEETETWFFSIIDVVQALTQQPDNQKARKYWNKLKERLKNEGSEPVTNCHRLKMVAEDGKLRLTDAATAELPEKIMAGEAAWLIMSAKSKNVYLNDAQQEEAEGIYSDIGRKYYEDLDGIEQSDLFVTNFNGQVHPNFIITKSVLLEIINSDYIKVLSSTIEKKPPPLPEEKKRQKAESITFSILKKWVKSLIQNTSCNTCPKFKDLMINTYFQKNPRDEIEKFNDGEKIIDVFCRLNEQKNISFILR